MKPKEGQDRIQTANPDDSLNGAVKSLDQQRVVVKGLLTQAGITEVDVQRVPIQFPPFVRETDSTELVEHSANGSFFLKVKKIFSR